MLSSQPTFRWTAQLRKKLGLEIATNWVGENHYCIHANNSWTSQIRSKSTFPISLKHRLKDPLPFIQVKSSTCWSSIIASQTQRPSSWDFLYPNIHGASRSSLSLSDSKLARTAEPEGFLFETILCWVLGTGRGLYCYERSSVWQLTSTERAITWFPFGGILAVTSATMDIVRGKVHARILQGQFLQEKKDIIVFR
jgi:hypothetical protein